MKTTYNQNQVQSLVASMKNGQRVTKQDFERILADLTKKTLCDLAKALDLHRYSSLTREGVAGMILGWYEDMLTRAEPETEPEPDTDDNQEDEDKAPVKPSIINLKLEREIANNVYEDLSDEAIAYLKEHPELRQNEDHDPTDLRHDIDALVEYYQHPALRSILEKEEGKQTQAKQTEATHLPTLPTIEDTPTATTEVIQPPTPVIEDKPKATIEDTPKPIEAVKPQTPQVISSKWMPMQQEALQKIPKSTDEATKALMTEYIDYVLVGLREEEDEAEIKSILLEGMKRIKQVLRNERLTERWNNQFQRYARKNGVAITTQTANRFLYRYVQSSFLGLPNDIFGLRYVDKNYGKRATYHTGTARIGKAVVK